MKMIENKSPIFQIFGRFFTICYKLPFENVIKVNFRMYRAIFAAPKAPRKFFCPPSMGALPPIKFLKGALPPINFEILGNAPHQKFELCAPGATLHFLEFYVPLPSPFYCTFINKFLKIFEIWSFYVRELFRKIAQNLQKIF